MATTRHVIPNPKGGWDNKRSQTTRASTHHDRKKDAVATARHMSQKEGSELKIHGKDGKIQSSDSHGKDPRKIPG